MSLKEQIIVQLVRLYIHYINPLLIDILIFVLILSPNQSHGSHLRDHRTVCGGGVEVFVLLLLVNLQHSFHHHNSGELREEKVTRN